MKKYILFLLISGSAFAQHTEGKNTSIWTRELRHVKDIAYIQYSRVEDDSLKIERRVSNFADANTSVPDELAALQLDHSAKEYIYKNNKQQTLFYAVYQNDAVVSGIVLDTLSFGKDKNRYTFYRNNQPSQVYVFDRDKHYLSFLTSSVHANKKALDYFYSLPVGAVSPTIESFSDPEGFRIKESKTSKQLISSEDTLNFVFSDTEDFFTLTIHKPKSIEYYAVLRKGNTITINSISYDNEQKEEGVLTKATISNVGLEQKRAITTTAEGKGVWDAYLENYALEDWQVKNQLVFKYKRGREKKPLHMRIVVGESIDKESYLYHLVVSIMRSPELFRRDVILKDFDYTQIVSSNQLILKPEKESKYTVLE
ncbi:hypothetical protein VSO92_05235 [Myroides pelagicus]|uniref:hypothetical protein n=1 Tax=Myroides pelagicus TaxID=270914 RepID=UPI002DBA24D8|nr:hypothetical protein [Myroides pelagicus]MEC4113511.1 hypothetical protein [Myroides pelagicus]